MIFAVLLYFDYVARFTITNLNKNFTKGGRGSLFYEIVHKYTFILNNGFPKNISMTTGEFVSATLQGSWSVEGMKAMVLCCTSEDAMKRELIFTLTSNLVRRSCAMLCWTLGCPKKTLFLNFVSAVEPLVRKSSKSLRKKFQRYRPIKDT